MLEVNTNMCQNVLKLCRISVLYMLIRFEYINMLTLEVSVEKSDTLLKIRVKSMVK